MAGVNSIHVPQAVPGRAGRQFAVDLVVMQVVVLQNMAIPSISLRTEKKMMCGHRHLWNHEFHPGMTRDESVQAVSP